MNTIPEDQNAPKQLERLAAQRQIYSDCKTLQTIQFTLSVPCVVAWSLIVAANPALRIYGAVWGAIVTLLEVVVFNTLQHTQKEQAAKIQELFDCDVLQLTWSDIKVGQRPNAEVIIAYSSKFRRKHSDYSEVLNWYPVEVGKLPLHLGRIVCQRANCWWDSQLRRRYTTWTVVIVIAVTFIVTGIGLLGGFTLENFLLSVVIPLMPALAFGIRQAVENRQSAERLDHIREHAERFWNTVVSDKTSPKRLAEASRALQDEIFQNRKSNALIYDQIYKLLKREYEEQMNKSATILVEEALHVQT